MSCRDISTLVNTILQVYMGTQGVLKSIYNGKVSILTLGEATVASGGGLSGGGISYRTSGKRGHVARLLRGMLAGPYPA